MKKTYTTPTLIVYQTESEVILSGSYRDFGMDDLPSDPGFYDDEYDY